MQSKKTWNSQNREWDQFKAKNECYSTPNQIRLKDEAPVNDKVYDKVHGIKHEQYFSDVSKSQENVWIRSSMWLKQDSWEAKFRKTI